MLKESKCSCLIETRVGFSRHSQLTHNTTRRYKSREVKKKCYYRIWYIEAGTCLVYVSRQRVKKSIICILGRFCVKKVTYMVYGKRQETI